MANHRPAGPARSNQSAIVVVPFPQVPYAAFFDARLHPNDVRLLGALLFFALDSDRCTPSDGRLAELLAVSDDTIRRSLDNLGGCGYVRREKAPRSATNATGRVLVLVWRTTPQVLPAVPDRQQVRIAEGTNSTDLHRPARAPRKPRTPAPVRDSSPGEGRGDTRTGAGPTPAPVRDSTPAPVRDKEEGLQELEECRPSSSGAGQRGETELEGDDADAMAGVRRCIHDTPRTRRDARKLIAEVGAEVVAGAAQALRDELDRGADVRYPMRWLERTARLMLAEGGAPGRAIPSADPAAWAARPDGSRPPRGQAERPSLGDQWRAEGERRREAAEREGRARLDGPAPASGPHFAPPVSKAEAARLRRQEELARWKARRKETAATEG